MAPPKKRKLEQSAVSAPAAKKGRLSRQIVKTASSSRPRRASAPSTTVISTKSSSEGEAPVARNNVNSRTSKAKRSTKPAPRAANESQQRRSSFVSVEVDRRESKGDLAKHEDETIIPSGSGSYWLMKAEPESRLVKGKDVKFSIEDLRAAQEPEGWNGVRNHAACKNLRAMKVGDHAFFYHSNCKFPGIVGTMEVVRESTIDESAFDPDSPYFDAKSKRDNPKWYLVHVKFLRKFAEKVPLTDLVKYAKPGGVLENLQTLKQKRLSVSKVTAEEWEFILDLVDPDLTESDGNFYHFENTTSSHPKSQTAKDANGPPVENEANKAPPRPAKKFPGKRKKRSKAEGSSSAVRGENAANRMTESE